MTQQTLSLPLYEVAIPAGFPSPAADYQGARLDLQELLIEQPNSTFFARAEGDSMIGHGIMDGALLVIDKSLTAKNGSVVVVRMGADMLIKAWQQGKGHVELHSSNPAYKPIRIEEGSDVEVWGVCTAAINLLK